ncbi:MAG TPA: SLC13 family permease [Egibacteraceae bacterium]|nr:SLC13 family permease [Egibacteraceae bacterium]
MNLDAWITLAVVVATVVVLARELVPPALAVLGATVLLLVVGVIDSEQAFSGFSNEAPITVAALFVLARAVELSGILQPVVQRFMGEASTLRGQLARIALPVAGASAFLNNTPLVAMTVPPVVQWAKRRKLPASRFLIPVSYAAVLGGAVTAIGTSTNLVVSGLLTETGMAPLGLFELVPVGLPIAVAGCGAIALLAGRLLPDRRAMHERFGDSLRNYSVSMQVVQGGPLEGCSIEAGGLRHLRSVYCVQVSRNGHAIAPVAPSEVLSGGDVLTFVGRVDEVVDLQRQRGLVSTEQRHLEALQGNGHVFFEAVVGDSSQLAGRTLKEVGFRGRYQGAVLAIHRAGQRVDAKLGEVPLRLGDTLLILADPGFRDRWRDSGDFLLIARMGSEPPAQSRKAPLVAGIALLMVLLAGTGVVPILHASLAAAGLLLAVGALSVRQARAAVDLDVIVVIAAAFGLGAAVTTSGLGDRVAGLLLGVFEPFGLVGALAGVLLAAMALTELISNNAAAVLLFPVAMSTAAALGVDPRPFAIAVTMGASLSFLTPIGYQTNLMVYGLGGYRFSDYSRLGVPLDLIVIAGCLLLIPRAFPF